jgi:uncharacterized membrane protein
MIGAYFVVLVAFIGGLLFWLPRLSHRELFFAVTVPGDFAESEPGQEILRRYRGRVALVTIVCAVLAVWSTGSAHFALLLATPFLEVGGCFWAFLRARASVLPHAVEPTGVREARLEPREIHLPGHWPAQIGPFAILAAGALYLHAEWKRIPARFPVHWALDGRPNGWSTRTPAGVYGPLLLGAIFVGLLFLLSVGILRWTRHVHATGSAAEVELARERRVLLVLLFSEYLVASIITWAALLPLRELPGRSPSPALPLGATAVLLLILLLVFLVHRPVEPAPARGAAPVGDRTEDRYWKGGVLYFNPNDPALLVEKRFGIGYTLNFGHRLAWVLLGAILLIPVLTVIAKSLLARH